MNQLKFNQLLQDLKRMEDPIRAKHSQRFFKTGKGEYGEGDIFVGLKLLECHLLVKEFIDLPYSEIQKALDNKYHEARLIGLLLLVARFRKGDEKEKDLIYEMYLKNTKRINNWDLVDVTADRIVGAYLFDKDKSILNKLAKSKILWEKRIAIMATFWFIYQGEFKKTFEIAEILLNDKEDLIHKAVGWMLREVGKRGGLKEEEEFLRNHKRMPRTMLRYAIEKFPEEKRQWYLKTN
jgi:3-methyladenine DNA glycosylase AlkD